MGKTQMGQSASASMGLRVPWYCSSRGGEEEEPVGAVEGARVTGAAAKIDWSSEERKAVWWHM